MNLAASIHLASKISRVCAVQPTVARGFSGTRKRSNLLCQAIAEPQTKPISEDQMRIANDVSELIGTLYLQQATAGGPWFLMCDSELQRLILCVVQETLPCAT